MRRIPDWAIRVGVPLIGTGLWCGLAGLGYLVLGLTGTESLLLSGLAVIACCYIIMEMVD